jgi:sugar (pentulose or hexulose) kinase
MARFLGIDLGSSFIKAAVLDLDEGTILASSSRPAPDFISTSGPEREIPVDELAGKAGSLIGQALSQYRLEGIVFAVQMHGFELRAPQGGAITGYVSWQDMRAFGLEGGQDIASCIRGIAGDGLLKRNGVLLNNSHSLCPLYHLMNEKKPPLPLGFAMIGDAVIRRLTGQVVPIHPTEAASTALYDLKARDWNRELLRLLSLEGIELPPVSETREPAAFYRAGNREIPVYLPIGDQQAAVLGCEAREGDVVLNIGTGGQICYVDKELSLGDYETRPFFSGRTIRTLTDLPSGRNLAVLMNLVLDAGRRLFGIDLEDDSKIWELTAALAREAGALGTGRSLELDMSFFDASGGAVKGITGTNLSAGNLFAAAYRNIAGAAYAAFVRLGLDERKAVKDIIGAGGALRRAPLLQELIARRFNRPFRLSPHSEDVMLGLLRLGRWHAGLIPVVL